MLRFISVALSFIMALCVLGCSQPSQANLVIEASASAPIPERNEPAEEFVARWNAWVDSVPDDQRIGDSLARLVLDLGNQFSYAVEGSDVGYFPNEVLAFARPGNQLWEFIDEVYGVAAPEIANMRELVARPWVALPIENVVMDWVLPEDGGHWAAHFFCDEAKYAIYTGQSGLVMDNLFAVGHVLRLSEERSGWIVWMRRSAIKSEMINTMYRAVQWDPDMFTDKQLTQLQDMLLLWERRDLTALIDFEEFVRTSHIRSVYTDSVNGQLSTEAIQDLFEVFNFNYEFILFDDHRAYPNLAQSDATQIKCLPMEQQVRMLNMATRLFKEDLVTAPFSQRVTLLSEFLSELDENGELSQYLPAMMQIYADGKLLKLERADSNRVRAGVAVLAIHRHRLQTGSWPNSLAEIDLAILRLDPIDLYTGKVFGYEVVNGHPRLWSGGADRDDDKGMVDPEQYERVYRKWITLDQWDALSDKRRSYYDGDWILFPIDDSDEYEAD